MAPNLVITPKPTPGPLEQQIAASADPGLKRAQIHDATPKSPLSLADGRMVVVAPSTVVGRDLHLSVLVTDAKGNDVTPRHLNPIIIRNPPVKVADAGKFYNDTDEDGKTVLVQVYKEDPAAALQSILRRVLGDL